MITFVLLLKHFNMHSRLEEKKTRVHRVLQNSRYHLEAENRTGRSGKAVINDEQVIPELMSSEENNR